MTILRDKDWYQWTAFVLMWEVLAWMISWSESQGHLWLWQHGRQGEIR
jgi:hypothetical protein